MRMIRPYNIASGRQEGGLTANQLASFPSAVSEYAKLSMGRDALPFAPYWSFDFQDGSGLVITDHGVQGLDGAIADDTDRWVTGLDGGSALLFAGSVSDEMLIETGGSSFDTTKSWLFFAEFSLAPGAVGDYSRIWQRTSALGAFPSGARQCRVKSDGKILVELAGGGSITGGIAVNDGSVHQLLMRYDAQWGRISWNIDGVPDAERSVLSSVNLDDTHNTWLGAAETDLTLYRAAHWFVF